MTRLHDRLNHEAVPAAIRARSAQLGANIALARKSRKWRQEDLARRAGLTRRVVIKIEAGQLGIALGAYIAALWAMGLDADLATIASPDRDAEGATLVAARQPKRVRPRTLLDDDF